ncbi:50S ribosomal protein L23 [Candidatus Gracilibacteria bacterium]|nr:50S ribosomal protein L23 [Candidatus Gracilibacteria bacterium]
MKNFTTIIKTIVTEKSSIRQESGQYTFLVKRSATKIDIKNAVKALYGADVDRVRILISPKKTRMYGRGRIMIKRPVQKKAIVTLKGKQTIDPSKILEHKPKKK